MSSQRWRASISRSFWTSASSAILASWRLALVAAARNRSRSMMCPMFPSPPIGPHGRGPIRR